MEPSPSVLFPISQSDIHIEGGEIGQKGSEKRSTGFYSRYRCMVELGLSIPGHRASVFIRLNLDLVLSLMVNVGYSVISFNEHIVSRKGGAFACT
jgi:hypothetical protein